MHQQICTEQTIFLLKILKNTIDFFVAVDSKKKNLNKYRYTFFPI